MNHIYAPVTIYILAAINQLIQLLVKAVTIEMIMFFAP